jgi:hypothetical protein
MMKMLPYTRKRAPAGPATHGEFAKNVEAIAVLFKALLWPALAMAAFIEFYQPIREAVSVIPKKMSESQKLSVGGLSIEIEKRATAVGDPELGALIGDLSPKAIELLLKVGRNSVSVATSSSDSKGMYYYLPGEDEFLAIAELERKSLLELGLPLATYRSEMNELLMFDRTSGTQGIFRPRRTLLSQEQSDVWKARLKLTDRGIKALELIITAVTNEMKRTAEQPKVSVR